MKHSMIIVCILLQFHSFLQSQDRPAFQPLDVFSLEWVDDPQISPDGKQVVYVRRGMDIMTDKRISRLWIINIDGSEHYKLTSQDVNESKPRWSPDGTRIAFTSSTENGSELFVYWKNTAKIARLSSLESSPRSIAWSPDGNHLAFTMFVAGKELSLVKPQAKPKDAKWAAVPRVTTRFRHEADGSGKLKPGFTHVFVQPASGGVPRQMTSGEFNHIGTPRWHPNGNEIIVSSNRNKNWEYDFRNSELYAIDVNSMSVTELTNRIGPDNNAVISSDGKVAYLGFTDKKQTYQLTNLYVKDLDGKSTMIELDLDRSIQSPKWSKDGESIYFMYDDHGNTKIAKTNVLGQVTKLVDNVGGTAIGRPYGGGRFSVANNGMVAYTYTTAKHPAELAVVDANGNSRLVMSLNEDVLPFRELAEVEEIWYTSSFDGRDIQGWIAYPPQYDPSKKYPLIVENHGGPISNYGARFSPEIQLLAAGGNIVFYPNPRGSTSYGEEFGNLLYHNYPGEDYNDVMDGVDALIAKGIAHEDKLFVTGGSAGGIMSAWMIGKNNRFEAAAVIKPVMNWISKTLTADNYYAYADTRYPGQPWENPEVYWNHSPISLVGNIETPTLVMVGSSDLRTPLSEAKQLYHALKIRKIDTALVEMPGAFHFIANRPSQLISKIEHILAWFELHQ